LKITISKIAELAGVSKATVSRALNNSGYVSPKTKEKILKIVQEHNYVPDAKAISLSKNLTNTVGLILPSTSGPFYGEIISGIESVFASKKLYTLLMTFGVSESPSEVRNRYLSLLQEKRVDGLIIFDPDVDEAFVSKIVALKYPCVFLGREFPGIDVDTVSVDNFRGSYMMMTHLIEVHKFKKIAFITGPIESYDSNERLRGYLYALSDYGIKREDNYIFRGDFTKESGRNLAEKILEIKPEAVFSANDEMALGFLEKLKEQENHPQIAVVGFDDAMWSKFIDPPLTTVRQPMEEMGKLAARIILERLQGNQSKDPVKAMLHTHLVVRHSCGC